MSLPANVRVNVLTPFPSRVSGSGAVKVTKANGIWTVGLDFSLLSQASSIADPDHTQFLIYDPVAKIFYWATISTLLASALTRVITAAGDVDVTNNDSIVIIDRTAPSTGNINLPDTTFKVGAVTIFDGGGVFDTYTQTLVPHVGQTIVGLASYALTGKFQSITLRPYGTKWLLQ